MRPGDVLHIPRGWWHQATRTGTGDGFSLHATFGLTRRTGVDWLAWVADQARADELFRRDLHQHSTLPALRPLLSGQPANIHEITTTTGINATTLADTLITEGICAELTPDLAEGYADMLTPTPA